MGNINNSVNNLISELETRINMLSSVEVKANLDTKSFDEITNIVKKYTERAPQDIEELDLIQFRISDIDELLHIMGVSPTEINRILVSFNKNVKLYQDEDSVEAFNFFTSIKNMISSYISSFINIDKAQNDIQNEKVTEYQRIIDILKSEKLEVPFEDMEMLMKLMTSLAMSNEDKWNILAHIANLNLSIAENKTEEYNYGSLIDSIYEEYVSDNSELVELIEKEVLSQDVDVELIPTYAAKLADESGHSTMLIQNIIVALIAHNIYSRYQNSEENREELESILKLTLEQQVSTSSFIIETTKEILSRNKTLYENINEDVMRYLDMTIASIEEEGYSKEEAIELKTLPILKTMAEVIDKASSLDESSKDYATCIEILTGFIESYANVISKTGKELIYK